MMQDTPLMLANRYEVRALVGRGGMAAVHLAYDTRLSRTVAVKLLRSDLAHDPMFRERFRREAQSAAGLNHPSIVAVYDTGEDPSPSGQGTLPYIVMEFVEGHTVRELLVGGDAVPLDEAVEITAGVLDALEYSHRMGIVHRDIKPGNIMITPQGAVKVMDFGIARALADSAATMTEASSVVGTAQYLSPEQARGEQVDARSDLYSTGCLLFELLTGQAPFRGDSAVAVAYQHVRETPPVPSSLAPDVPETLDRVVMKALAKDREDRYPDAGAFRADLQAAGAGLPVAAPATQVWGVPGGVAAGAGAASVAAPTAVLAAGEGGATTTLTGAGSVQAAPEEERTSRWWVWPLVILGLLALLGGVFLLTRDDSDLATVTVPDLTGMDQAEARQAVENAQLAFALGEPEPSQTVPEGEVTSSDPSVGAGVPEGSEVEVRFSSGPNAVAVPDVTGRSQGDARDILEDAGLSVGDVQPVDEPGREGSVLRTDPAAGSSSAIGSSVTLVTASGLVELPDLVGMSEDEALATLSDLGLDAVVSEQEASGAQPGTVVSMDPSPGTIASGSTVSVIVAREPDEPAQGTDQEPAPAPTTQAPTPAPTTQAPTQPPSRTPTAPPTRTPTAPPTRTPQPPPTQAPEPTDPPATQPTEPPATQAPEAPAQNNAAPGGPSQVVGTDTDRGGA